MLSELSKVYLYDFFSDKNIRPGCLRDIQNGSTVEGLIKCILVETSTNTFAMLLNIRDNMAEAVKYVSGILGIEQAA